MEFEESNEVFECPKAPKLKPIYKPLDFQTIILPHPKEDFYISKNLS